MAISQIRWKQGDYISLGKAVSNFNKKIKELENEENKSYLPSQLSYAEIKGNITTRAELKRQINSLRRFLKEDATDKYITTAGEEMTKWERRELSILQGSATRRLKKEYGALGQVESSGYSRIQMGSQRAREIKATLDSLKNVEKVTGKAFEKLKSRIFGLGVSDYEMKKAITYRMNYMEMIKTFKNYDNYDKFFDEIDKHSNPLDFFNWIKNNPLLQDIQFMYDFGGDGIATASDQANFNNLLRTVGIEIDE